jgi:protein SMG6
MVAGYTVLVVDTNILLSSLPRFTELVEARRWTIVVPLAVITELDGLSVNKNDLGESAAAAVEFITRQIRTHSISLKVQTSKGNYLSNLAVRSEELNFEVDGTSWERSMDDLILRAAIWQDEHWVDRSSMLGDASLIKGAAKVVLLSFDRNRESARYSIVMLAHSRPVRLKARARQLPVANEKEMATALGLGR